MLIAYTELPQAVPPTPQMIPGAPPAGPALSALGRQLVGRLVMRYWPEDQGWWEAYVGDFSSTRGHKLLYEHNTPDESQVRGSSWISAC